MKDREQIRREVEEGISKRLHREIGKSLTADEREGIMRTISKYLTHVEGELEEDEIVSVFEIHKITVDEKKGEFFVEFSVAPGEEDRKQEEKGE